MRRLNRYLDARPALAIAIGMLVWFLIMYFAAPDLLERADQPVTRSTT
jgi:hypothetical protein